MSQTNDTEPAEDNQMVENQVKDAENTTNESENQTGETPVVCPSEPEVPSTTATEISPEAPVENAATPETSEQKSVSSEFEELLKLAEEGDGFSPAESGSQVLERQ